MFTVQESEPRLLFKMVGEKEERKRKEGRVLSCSRSLRVCGLGQNGPRMGDELWDGHQPDRQNSEKRLWPVLDGNELAPASLPALASRHTRTLPPQRTMDRGLPLGKSRLRIHTYCSRLRPQPHSKWLLQRSVRTLPAQTINRLRVGHKLMQYTCATDRQFEHHISASTQW